MASIAIVIAAGLAGYAGGRWWKQSREFAMETRPVSRGQQPLASDSAPPPAPGAAIDAGQRVKQLSKAFHLNDPLGSAAELVSLIDSLTLDDFRWLESNPGEFPIPRDGEFDDTFKQQFYNALLERWAVVDPGGVFTKASSVEKYLKRERQLGPSALTDALVRVRPELILNAPDANANQHFQALRELGARDVAAARKYRDRYPPEERKSVDAAIARGLAKSDPLAAAATALELNDKEVFKDAVDGAARLGADVLRQVLESGRGDLTRDLNLQKLMLRFPHLPWDSLPIENKSRDGIGYDVIDDARRLAPGEREAVLARLSQLPPGARDDVATAITSGWVREDPRATLDWSLAHANSDNLASPANRPLTWAFWDWMSSDKQAALAWLAQVPPSALRDSLSCQAATALIRMGETEGAIQMFKPVPGSAGVGLVENLASSQARRDPAAAASWLDSLPANVDTGKASESIVSQWFSKDPAATANWVESLPSGSRREYALQAYARSAARKDPMLAAEWAATVSDPFQRARAAEAVYNELAAKDPGGAREWLRQLPGLDEHWREAVLRNPW
jgi:hypothetical protein